MADDQDDDGSYTVGYGRPPRDRRFQKGPGGNRKGRRKGVHNMDRIIWDMLKSKTKISINGRVRQVTVREALAQRYRKEILTGPLRALQDGLATAARLSEKFASSDDPAIMAQDEIAKVLTQFSDGELAAYGKLCHRFSEIQAAVDES